MNHFLYLVCLVVLFCSLSDANGQVAVDHSAASDQAECQNLLLARDLTIIFAEVFDQTADVPSYCYVKGLIDGSITFHVQLPLAHAWNGRLVHLGDGGSDGDLDYVEQHWMGTHWLEQGYAVTNSNTGHDRGALGNEFGFRDERATVNFAYRAVHATVMAAKSIVNYFYGKPHEYAYHVGCSTGGRQGLLAAQLYPFDFDGIVAGAPGHLGIHRAAHRLSIVQHLYKNDFEANLAFDGDENGSQEDLSKLDILADIVLENCDHVDGIVDGIIDPGLCNFDLKNSLEAHRCKDDINGANCFTQAQFRAIEHLYEGSRNARGELVYPGAPLGTERAWGRVFIPHEGNDLTPYALGSGAGRIAYAFYKDDPGLLPPDITDTSYQLYQQGDMPEWGWWNFDINDIGSERMSRLMPTGTDANIERFLLRNGGKLLLFHGWADVIIPPEPTIDYYADVVDTVFGEDATSAASHIRLFMAPGMGHCRGGIGPNQADYLAALSDWVENGNAPDRIIARHFTDGKADNERPFCPYPQRAVYTGPPGGENDSVNWKAANFTCK